ncbi:MAG: RES family NAD+ phosphorylase [Acidobacteria bacterium]|nr:RES family NAD+ phosphorylase [Acidobacteriota bacterium]
MTRGYAAGRIRTRLRPLSIEQVCRVIRARRAGGPLDATPADSRFSDPDGRYGVLYAARNVRTSFVEAVLRSRFDRRRDREIPAEEVQARSIVWIDSLSDLNLVDLRRDGPIRIGAPTAVAHDANHAAGRSLSAFVYAEVDEADGFLYDSRFTGDVCLAVFDRAIEKLTATMVVPLMDSVDFHEALREYEIILTRP